MTLSDYFRNDAVGDYQIEQIQFSDGTIWTTQDIKEKVLVTTEYSDTVYGYATNDTIDGKGGNDYIDGKGGNDVIYGGDGADTLMGDAGNDFISGDQGDDYISDFYGSNTLLGGAGNDTLYAGFANDVLIGGTGNDTLSGGDGSDIYQFDLNFGQDLIGNWDPGKNKTDIIQFGEKINPSSVIMNRVGGASIYYFGSVDLLLTFSDVPNQLRVRDHFYNNAAGGYQIDKIQFADGTVWQHFILGSSSFDTLMGTDQNDYMDGKAAADILTGGLGDDYYLVDNISDQSIENLNEGTDTIQSSVTYTLSKNLENLTLTGTDAINGFGNDLNNKIIGNSANNLLSGGTGNDLLMGGQGDDTYVINSSGNSIIENANEGIDTVQSSIIYTLGANLENLVITGTNSTHGTGNELDNVIIGNAATNTLNGAVGADTLMGGLGNDVYIIDNINDQVIENINEGTDTIQTSITCTLSDNIERLILTGTEAINGFGNNLNNKMTGNSADNFLDGGFGIEQYLGGQGNDTYVINSSGDSIIENFNEGIDTVQSSIIYTLGANLENLVITGTNSTHGTGNELDNIIIGNAATNTLNGAVGADTLMGGLGNDVYIIDNINDQVIENLNEGTDTIQTNITYTLSENIERLILTGTEAINGFGNNLNNRLTGNAADNFLDGGVGIEQYLGGQGNDTYVINSSGDSVIENFNEGIDTVQSSVTYTLAANVENLTLTGTAAIQAVGNELNNRLVGNIANNTLNGGAGDDIYQFNPNAGKDTFIDSSGHDTLIFGEGINADQLWFKHTSNNLVVTRIGTTDTAILKDWYLNTETNNSHIEVLKSGDGKTLLDTQVENLVQAMASFAVPAIGQTTLPTSYQTVLNPLIAANWS